MAKPRPVKVIFPLGGQNRRAGYAQKFRPYTTPRAINVRGVGPLEKRGRGGSRPGLSKYVDNDFGTNITAIDSVTYIDASGNRQQDLAVIADGTLSTVRGTSVTTTTSYLTDDNGNRITTETGDPLIFQSTVSTTNPLGDTNTHDTAEWNGKIYIADSTLQAYDPLTGTVDTVAGAPSSMPLVSIYRERVVLSGVDHLWYMSGIGDATDWDAGAEFTNQGRAVFGAASMGGIIGEKVLAQLPYEDKAILFGCQDSLWVVYGNPAAPSGRQANVSRYVGVIGPRALTITPNGLCVFMSRRGLYTWQIGSTAEPEPFSDRLLPEELLDIDTTAYDIDMAYDHRNRGIHLCLTPTGINEIGTHWWLDMDNRAMWEASYQYDHQPLVMAKVSRAGYTDIVFGCRDGYLRVHDDSATTDDGTAIKSDILLGPFNVARQNGMDGQIMEIVGAFAAGTGDVDWKIVVGDSAEEVVDRAETSLDGDGLVNVDKIGTWGAGQNSPAYPRSRGPWAILWLSADEPWSYEAITMYNAQVGRLRNG